MNYLTASPLAAINKGIRGLFLFALLFASVEAVCQDIPQPMSPPRLVNDFAGILEDADEALLEQKLVAFNDTTSTQIAVVTISNIGGYDIADYSYKLFEAWGIGQKNKNNGALMLVAVENRKVWIATGYGLEGTLTDALTKRIVNNIVLPAFKKGNYLEGIDQATTAMAQIVAGEYTSETTAKKRGKGISAIGVVILVIIILIILSRFNNIKKNHMGRGLDLFTLLMLMNAGGGGRGSYGDFRSGGGGFGGFGGGSSGGGGAGGSW
jgi:uncharacterized protein